MDQNNLRAGQQQPAQPHILSDCPRENTAKSGVWMAKGLGTCYPSEALLSSTSIKHCLTQLVHSRVQRPGRCRAVHVAAKRNESPHLPQTGPCPLGSC